jgi:hypothetical protein
MLFLNIFKKQITQINMENPLVSMPPEENKPVEQPAPMQEQPAPLPTKEGEKAKKPFFTKGKIIAIFIGLVVIAAIVGAVIYYRSAEQFKGASFTTAPATTTTTTIQSVTTTQPVVELQVEKCAPDKGLGESSTGVYGCACNLDERTPNPKIWEPIDRVWTEDPVPYPDPCVCPDEKPIWDSTNKVCTTLTLAPVQVTAVQTFVPPEEETCENTSATADLITAYNQRNWDAYQGALQRLDDLACIDPCKLNIYWTIFYLNTNNIDQAKVQFATFKKNCGTNCNLYFGYLGIVAEIMSDIDQRAQTVVEAKLPGLTDAHLDFLRLVAEGYINSCQCIELEQLLTNPVQSLDSYFPADTTSALDLNATKAISPATLSTSRLSSGLTVAYAQSYSPTVQSVLQSVFDSKCPPEQQKIPNNCEGLNIEAPFDSDSYVMSDLFDPSIDNLGVKIVGGEDNIQNYKYTSDSGTVKFNESSSSYNTSNKTVTLSGGPNEGETDKITVTAIDVTGLPLKECTDSVVLSRPKADQPVCKSLKIIAPDDANQTGTPTVEISSPYNNEVLKVALDAEAGSYDDIRYTSDKGNITFNGQGVLDTTSLEVKMNGAPPEDTEELVTVWARAKSTDGSYSGIKTCTDAFIVKIPGAPPTLTYVPPTTTDEEPPPTITYVPPTTTEEEPPPVITYVPPTTTITTSTPTEPAPIYVTQTQPQPTIITTTATPIHAAAPATPSTGPGLIIPLIATAMGGAWLRRKKK